MSSRMEKRLKPWMILVTLAVVTSLVAFWAISYSQPPSLSMERRPHPAPRGDIELYYTFKTVISTVNATLLFFLLLAYVDIYIRVKSDFTVGLLIFSMILLLYALSDNPVVHWIFGYRAFGLGPFAMLPDLFACVALSVLLYLTFKY